MLPDLIIARYDFKKNRLFTEIRIMFLLVPTLLNSQEDRLKESLYSSLNVIVSPPTRNGFSSVEVFSKK
jgi:hypothetical protein